jgi:hypothetical protein
MPSPRSDPADPTDPADTEDLGRLARSPHLVAAERELADEVARLGCLTYSADDPARLAQGRALLASHPESASGSLHAAATLGDAAAAEMFLAADPSAANRQCGPFRWEPLLYVAYGRIDSPDPRHDPLAVARLLLARGADPDVGYLWEGLPCPFTALTGALGGGEGGQPPHHRWHELASLLLDAGADANDAQAVYNLGLGDGRPAAAHDDTDHLKLLYRYGLGRGDGGPWRRRLGPGAPEPADLVAEVLQHAAEAGLERRARLVLREGADPDRRARHPIFAGRTPYRSALHGGNLAIAALLVAAGADTSDVDDVTRLVTRVLAGDRTAREADPGLLRRAVAVDPYLAPRAAARGRAGAIELMTALGWDVNACDRMTALHAAAWRDDRELVERLLQLGADPATRDRDFDATPAGWAAHGGHRALADRLDAALTERRGADLPPNRPDGRVPGREPPTG